MKNNEVYLNMRIYESDRIERDKFNNIGPSIACRIVVFDNNIIMAEEVKTKKVFPILLEDDNGKCTINNDDIILNGKYFVKLGINNNYRAIVHNEIINNFNLLNYIENNEQLYFKSPDSKRPICFFDYVCKLSDKNRYTIGDISTSRKEIGYRYLTNDAIKHMDDRDGTEYLSIDFSSSLFNQVDISLLEKYGFDLSSVDIDSFVGREREIKEIIKTIGIKKKSAILVGESGCGKTAIVSAIAKEYMYGFLENKKIFYINSTALIAGTRYRGDFEEKFNNIIKTCEKYRGNIILFFDEIHILKGLGASEDNRSNDAFNILKPYIDTGKIIVIGATTIDEYNKYILSDSAFARRMEKINIPNLTDKEIELILLSYLNDLENKYNIELDLNDDEVIIMLRQLIRITSINRQKAIDNVKIINPALSKDILENAFVEAVYNESIFVTIDDIYYAIENHSNLSSILVEEMKNSIGNSISYNKREKVKKKVLSISDIV